MTPIAWRITWRDPKTGATGTRDYPQRAAARGYWRRIYSNAGTCYIGRLSATGENIIVRDYQ